MIKQSTPFSPDLFLHVDQSNPKILFFSGKGVLVCFFKQNQLNSRLNKTVLT